MSTPLGVVLAAGAGHRLRPYTDTLPKTLVPIGDTTPLEVICSNLAEVGITEIAVVVGHAAEAIAERRPELERRFGVTLHPIQNDRALTANNCYSLWCARDCFTTDDVLLVNGDTVHPVAVEHALLDPAARPDGAGGEIVLATDTVKRLGAEEMKLTRAGDGAVAEISKELDPAVAYGEYIGVTLIRRGVGERLAAALETTWRRDPTLYYEDGFVELIRTGRARIEPRPIGDLAWVEIDDHADLKRAVTTLSAIRAGSSG